MNVINMTQLNKKYDVNNKKDVLDPHFKVKRNKLVRNSHINGKLGNILDIVYSRDCLTPKDIAYDLGITVMRANTLLKKYMKHYVKIHRIRDNNVHCYKIKKYDSNKKYYKKRNLILGYYKPQLVIGYNYYKNFLLTVYDPKLSPFERRIIKLNESKSSLELSKKVAIMSQENIYRKEAFYECINWLKNIYSYLRNQNTNKNNIDKITNDLRNFINRRTRDPLTTVVNNVNFFLKHKDLFPKPNKIKSKRIKKEINEHNSLMNHI